MTGNESQPLGPTPPSPPPPGPPERSTFPPPGPPERGTFGATILGIFPLIISLAVITTIVIFILPIKSGPPEPGTSGSLWDQWYRYVALATGLLVSILTGLAVAARIRASYTAPASTNPRVYGELRARWDDLSTRLTAYCPPEPAKGTDSQTVLAQFAAWLAARAAANPDPSTIPAQFEAWLAAQPTPNPDPSTIPAQFAAWLAVQPTPNPDAPTVWAQTAACLTAQAHARFIGTELGALPSKDGQAPRQASGARWVLGTGFIDLWAHLHSAEEALYLVQSEDEVIGNGVSDEMRLRGSAIDNSIDYLDKLRWGVVTLGGGKYLTGSPPLPTIEPEDQTPGHKRRARVVLREVRRVINEYRDARRDGLVRSRNQLLWTGTVTGLAAYALLAVVVLTVPDGQPGREAIIAAAAFFLVGAVVGLFDQLRRGSGTETAPEEDYGVARARLLYVPLLSGLAAVGGVLLTTMLYGTLSGTIPPNAEAAAAATPGPAVVAAAAATPSPTPVATATPATATPATATPATATPSPTPVATATPEPPGVRAFTPDVPSLESVFDLQENGFSLVIAAVFGLTPGLLVERLQNQAARYTSELQSTSAQSTLRR